MLTSGTEDEDETSSFRRSCVTFILMSASRMASCSTGVEVASWA
jgi:hypothetical protein